MLYFIEGSNLPSGVYLCRFQVEGFQDSGKLVLRK